MLLGFQLARWQTAFIQVASEGQLSACPGLSISQVLYSADIRPTQTAIRSRNTHHPRRSIVRQERSAIRIVCTVANSWPPAVASASDFCAGVRRTDVSLMLGLSQTQDRLTCVHLCAISGQLLDFSWYVMAHGDARQGKWRGNWRMQWVASTLHTTSEHGVSKHYYRWCRTPLLPVVDWTDAHRPI